MTRKKKTTPDDPQQFARFVELAEQIKADDAEERFEEVMGKIITAKPKKGSKEQEK
ncbi:MAG: hypothetical protein M0Z81_01200 [Deltaproteobacteria bacterium]|jgi:hypothetical protein|nr:hypothetical protein [Deltaproteobacteria bacterium]